MNDALFIGTAALLLFSLLTWGIRVLHREEWQFAASLPGKRLADGTWEGVNLTYYGFFNALAHTIAVFFLITLTGAAGIAGMDVILVLVLLLGVCVPSSHLLARWIEKKAHTFTIGGASFVGIVLSPLAVWAVFTWMHPGQTVPFMPLMAAMSIAYAVGEGVGRLACISFGCCYGKPMTVCHPLLQSLIGRRGVIYSGSTKKIIYESGLHHRPVFPVQAVTSFLYSSSALVAAYLFLNGLYGSAFLITMLVTQIWRPLSELLRADYRGGGSLSVYQIMAIVASGLALLFWFFLPSSTAMPDIRSGLLLLWDPLVILLIELWGAIIFLYTGKSRVTGVRMSFYVHQERI